MPARDLARLIEQKHPGASVRALERNAGAAPQTVQRWLKSSTEYNRLPDPRAIREIARVLGCRVAEVVHAFNESLDDPLPLTQLPDDELTLLSRYRAMPPHRQQDLLAVARTFAVHSTDEQEATEPAAPPARKRRSGSRLPKAEGM